MTSTAAVFVRLVAICLATVLAIHATATAQESIPSIEFQISDPPSPDIGDSSSRYFSAAYQQSAQSNDASMLSMSGSAGQGGGGGTGGDDLASKIVDPTAALTQVVVQNRWISEYHGLDASQNTWTMQPVIPFKFIHNNHILRATLPYRADGPNGDGLDSVQIFDLIVKPFGNGRLGVGGIMNFSPATAADSDTFQMGPAFGWVGQKGKLTYGLFNQNLFSDEVEVSFLQPILAYSITQKTTVSLGDLQLGYSWKTDDWVSLPIGFQVNRIVNIRDTYLRLFYNPQYNFHDQTGSPEWTHIFGVALLVP